VELLHFLISPSNLILTVVAIAAAVLLLVPNFKGNRATGGVTSAEAIQMVNRQQAVWVDLRSTEQFQAGHIAQARHLPAADIEQKLSGLPKNKPLILVDDAGRESNRVAAKLRTQGLGDVFVLSGGMRAWSQASLPVTKK